MDADAAKPDVFWRALSVCLRIERLPRNLILCSWKNTIAQSLVGSARTQHSPCDLMLYTRGQSGYQACGEDPDTDNTAGNGQLPFALQGTLGVADWVKSWALELDRKDVVSRLARESIISMIHDTSTCDQRPSRRNYEPNRNEPFAPCHYPSASNVLLLVCFCLLHGRLVQVLPPPAPQAKNLEYRICKQTH
jgi:hypothetical protein